MRGLANLAPLLSLGARHARRAPEDVLALGDALLWPPDCGSAARRGGRSELNNDGCPVQLCLTTSAEGHRVRVLVDPAWWHGDPRARLDASGRALTYALRWGRAERLAPLARQLLEFIPLQDSRLVESFDRGFIWIGAGLDRPGVAVYLDARPFGREGAWEKAEQWLGGLAARRQMTGLRRLATVASIGFEGTDPEHALGKLYFRLDRAVPLGELGTDLLGDPALARFMVQVIGHRPMRLSGLVFSLGFDLGTGSVTDAKADLCGHCLPYDSVAWAGLLQNLTREFGLRHPACAAEDLLAGACDVAFLGFGVGAAGGSRLNVYLRPPRDDSPVTARTRDERVRASCHAAVDYLRGLQEEDGGWQEYRLPVGSSTQWVTGFTGLALAQTAVATGDTGARAAAEAAARWLFAHHNYPAGWGYNDQTGADADATAVVIRLLRLLGMPVPGHDERWLLGHWRPGGGFATYDGPGYWGAVHPCVTAMAALALDDATVYRLGDELTDYLKKFSRADGTWPSYWWRGHHYSTFHHLQMLRRLGLAGAFPAPVPGLGLAADAPAFDLAYATGTAWLAGDEEQTDMLLTRLINDQRFDGSWPGAASLRVTEPDCARPWESPSGSLYPDLRGVMTTASALLAFAAILGADP